MSHVFFASATGGQQIEPASRLVIRQNAFAHSRALSRTLAHSRALSRTLAYQHLDYIFCSCTACSLTQGCTVLFFDAGFATCDYVSSCSNPATVFARKSIASSCALRRLAKRLARLRCRRTSAHASPLPTARSGGDRGFRQRFLKSHGIRSGHPFPLSELIENQFLKSFRCWVFLCNSVIKIRIAS